MNSNRNEQALGPIIWKSAVALFIFLAVYLIAMILFSDELARVGTWLGNTIGLWGVFLFTLVVDTFIVPASADVLFAVTREWPALPLLVTMSVASIIGGFFGLHIGRFLGTRKVVQNLTAPYRERGEALIRRYGPWAIVIAGITPVPYSTVSWIAGILGMKRVPYLLASLSRFPRFVVYYLAIQGSLSIFGI